MGSKRLKRIKPNEENGYIYGALSTCWRSEASKKNNFSCPQVLSHFDPFSTNLLHELDVNKYGSVTKDIQDLMEQRKRLVDIIYGMDPTIPKTCVTAPTDTASEITEPATSQVVNLDDVRDVTALQKHNSSELVVIIDSDDDDDATPNNCATRYSGLNLPMSLGPGKLLMKDSMVRSM